MKTTHCVEDEGDGLRHIINTRTAYRCCGHRAPRNTERYAVGPPTCLVCIVGFDGMVTGVYCGIFAPLRFQGAAGTSWSLLTNNDGGY